MKPLNPIRKVKGFSLIELLVVVAIIAMLATGAISVYPRIMLDVKAKSAMKNAYQIWIGLNAYANNNEQVFPSETADGSQANTSNDALRMLFVRDWVDDEKLFFVQGSGWHGIKTSPDNDKGTSADNFNKALEAGENHWGYVRNLTLDRDDTTKPLLMDGGVNGSPGKWTEDPKAPGGAWKGKKAVVVRIGGSAKVMDLDNTFTAKDKKGDMLVDVFSSEFGTKSEDCLNPLAN
jgi:prepilin-type N-terminal cleavage/methylation domain-containing protein